MQVFSYFSTKQFLPLKFIKRFSTWIMISVACLFLILFTSLPVIAQQLGVVSFDANLITLRDFLGNSNGVDLNVFVAVPNISSGSATVETSNPFTYYNSYIYPDPSVDSICGFGTPEDIAGISSTTYGRNLTFQGRAACQMGEGYYLGAYQARVTDNNGTYPSGGFYRDMDTIQTLVANS